jgi:hypothetical protein
MVVKAASVEFIRFPMSTKSCHSFFGHGANVNSKSSALIGHELDFNEVDSSVRSPASQLKRKSVRSASVDHLHSRSYDKTLLDEHRQDVGLNTLKE